MIKKLYSKIKNILEFIYPWRYKGTKGVYSYYENSITGERKAYTDPYDICESEDLKLDTEWLNRKKELLED